jgi:hypothetical protein
MTYSTKANGCSITHNENAANTVVSGLACSKKSANALRFLPEAQSNIFKSVFLGNFDVGGDLATHVGNKIQHQNFLVGNYLLNLTLLEL